MKSLFVYFFAIESDSNIVTSQVDWCMFKFCWYKIIGVKKLSLLNDLTNSEINWVSLPTHSTPPHLPHRAIWELPLFGMCHSYHIPNRRHFYFEKYRVFKRRPPSTTTTMPLIPLHLLFFSSEVDGGWFVVFFIVGRIKYYFFLGEGSVVWGSGGRDVGDRRVNTNNSHIVLWIVVVVVIYVLIEYG